MGGFCCMGWRGIDGVGGGGEGRRVGETYGFERRGTGEVGCYRGWGLGRLGEGGGGGVFWKLALWTGYLLGRESQISLEEM